MRLAEHTLRRTTFCYPDSHLEPEHFGVHSRLSTVVKLALADDRDAFDDYVEAQALKRVWHYVARFGTPELSGQLGTQLLREQPVGERLVGDGPDEARDRG